MNPLQEKLNEIRWNYDPKLGDFLSKQGVIEIVNLTLEEAKNAVSPHDPRLGAGHNLCRYETIEALDKMKLTKQ